MRMSKRILTLTSLCHLIPHTRDPYSRAFTSHTSSPASTFSVKPIVWNSSINSHSTLAVPCCSRRSADGAQGQRARRRQGEDVRGDGERTQEQNARTARERAQSSGTGDGGSNAVATCDACERYHSGEKRDGSQGPACRHRRVVGRRRGGRVAPEAPEITTQDEEAEGERSANVIVGGAESESDIPPAGSLEEAPAADTSADPNEENEAETLATDSA